MGAALGVAVWVFLTRIPCDFFTFLATFQGHGLSVCSVPLRWTVVRFKAVPTTSSTWKTLVPNMTAASR